MDKPKPTGPKDAAKPRPKPGPDGVPSPPKKPRRSWLSGRPKEFMQVGGSPVPGLTLRRILRGNNTDTVLRFNWSPRGLYLASPSGDTITIWDVERGESLGVLKGHRAGVVSVAWSPDGQRLASGADDGTIRVWDATTWRSLSVIESHETGVSGVAWSPDGQRVASSSWGAEVHITDASTWKTVTTFKRHAGQINDIAWSPGGEWLASGSTDEIVVLNPVTLQELTLGVGGAHALAWMPDKSLLASGSYPGTVQIWDMPSGELKLELEGQTGLIQRLSFSADGTLLATKGDDGAVHLWRTDTWQRLATLPETVTGTWPPGPAFHPRLPYLATLGREDTVVRIWEPDVAVLLGGRPATESVRYTTAKLVLVGDSGVGKTGLGWRLAHGEFKEHASTHGQQFWVIDELRTRREDGTECEAVLWDLAGQPVYRPVHAIFLEDVDLSLVLFDPTNRQEPLKGAEFWLEHLAVEKKLPPSVLVGARTDRGTAVLSRQELEQFCQKHGISGGYVATSAKSGEGLDRLLETIKAQIPWEQMTATVTTVTFKRIKEYVLELKERPDRSGVLVRPAELRARLEATDPAWEFTDAEMMKAAKHLGTHGYVSVLRGSSGEEVILLTPELLVDLASSVVLQADKHPRDLGALSETELLKGAYPLAELADLETAEQQVLLDAAVARFLTHNICFRETLGADTLLIFPGLIKQKRPLLDEVEAVEDVSYLVRGRVENVYAALVVLLGYTQTFTRVNQWQRQAQYQMREGEICGFRLIDEREGEIELVLYYSASMPAHGRTMFRGLFEQFLHQRDVEVTHFPPVACPAGHRQERTTVVKRIRDGKAFLHCEECGERIALPEIEKPLVLGARDARLVRRAEALARLRSTYEAHLVRVKGFRRDRAAPRCHISHAPEQAAWASQLARDLRDAGVYLPEEPGRALDDDFLVVVGTPDYGRRWGADAATDAAVNAGLVGARLRHASASTPTVIPLLLEGGKETSLPPELQGCLPGDFRDESQYAVSLFDLVLTLYAIPLNRPSFAPLREGLRRQWEETLGRLVAAAEGAGGEIFISYAWGDESEAVADRLDEAFRARGVNIVRDKRDLGFKGRIQEFMERLGRGRCVILIVSGKYLKSRNCLFELLHVAKHGDFYERVFPVVLKDARIYDAEERLRYVRYWERKKRELDRAMKGVSAEHMQGFREDIDLYAEIRRQLPRLTDILRDMNALSPETHGESGFEELFKAVMAKLAE